MENRPLSSTRGLSVTNRNVNKTDSLNVYKEEKVKKSKLDAVNDLLARFTGAMRSILVDDPELLSGGEVNEVNTMKTRLEEGSGHLRPRLLLPLANNTPASSSDAGGRDSESWEMVKK